MAKQKRLIDIRRGELFAEDHRNGLILNWNHSTFIYEPDERESLARSETIPVDYEEGRFAFYLGVREKLFELTGDIDYADNLARRAMVNADTFRGFVWGLMEKGVTNGPFPEGFVDEELMRATFEHYIQIWNYEPYQWKIKRLNRGRSLAHQVEL